MVLPLRPNKTVRLRSQVWWLTPIISALEPEDGKPEASLGYVASPYFKKEKEETRGRQGEEGKRREGWS